MAYFMSFVLHPDTQTGVFDEDWCVFSFEVTQVQPGAVMVVCHGWKPIAPIADRPTDQYLAAKRYWQLQYGFGAVFPGILLFYGIFAMPESNIWKHKHQVGAAALQVVVLRCE